MATRKSNEQTSHASSFAFRGDIEGLRAIAVLAVLAYHAKIGPFRGGYIGVDVFFVISGYLITSLLMRDLGAFGSKALSTFWARRARRLLPGSFAVLIATMVAGRLVLDPLAQRDLMRDGIAATTFTANVVFAHRQNDYLAAQLAPSPLLHFWSLALEEQFYIGWPLLLFAAMAVRRRLRWFPAALIGSLLTVSLVLCIRLTPHHQPASFFLLPTRAWELLAGAALASTGPAICRVPGVVRAIGGWVGLGAIVVTAWRFSDLTLFPGAMATVPVVATVLVLAAGAGDRLRAGPGVALDRGPLTWIGARSYGIYLWHWPILVLAAARLGPLSAFGRGCALVLAVGVAAWSYRFIENPARRSVWLGARARRSLALGGALGITGAGVAIVLLMLSPSLTGRSAAAAPMLVLPPTAVRATSTPPAITPATVIPSVINPSTIPTTTTPTTTVSATAVTATTVPPSPSDVIASIIAANALTLQQAVVTDSAPANLTPSLGSARGDKPVIYGDGCMLSNGQVKAKECAYGDTASSRTIVLFGDSHAAQWFPALQEMSVRNHWRLEVQTKKGCPTADIPIADPARSPECGPWRTLVLARLADEHPDLVIMSAYRYTTTSAAIGANPDEVWRNGMQTTLDNVRPLAGNVMVLGDTPTPLNDVPGCVAAHLRHISDCMNRRSAAIKPGRLGVELDVATAHDAMFVPTGDWLCAASDCPVVIGNLLVYRDNSHITTAASMWLEPYLEAAVKPILDNATLAAGTGGG